jgi:hypothetical protein
MPPFRIHQTKIKPERILIRLLQGRIVLPTIVQGVPLSTQSPVNESESKPPEKKSKTISLKQIKQLVLLLQQTQQKNVTTLLPVELQELLKVEDNPDQVPDEKEEEEFMEPLFDSEDDDDDLLIIDV